MSGGRQTRSLFYPVRQLNRVCRVDAEEDVKDFRPLLPGLDPPEIVGLFLYPVRLAVVPVFSSRVAGVSSDLFRFDSKQSLVHLQAVHQTGPFIE